MGYQGLPYKILHIDDNIDSLYLFKINFEKWFVIESEQVPGKGLNKLKNDKYHAVVLDYDIPGKNGIEILREIRKDFPHIPVVFFTCHGNEEVAREAFLQGAVDYFSKDVKEIAQREKIANSIIRAIKKSYAEQELIHNREKLKESSEKLLEILENMSSGVVVYESINDGQDFLFRDFNKAAEIIENIKREDLLGKSVREVFPGIVEFGLFEVFHRVWKSGKPELFPLAFYRDNRISGWRENYVYKLSTGEIVTIYDDVTRYVKADKHIVHINKILHANRTIDQLLLDEIDVEKLIQEICDTLVGSGAYESAWIVLLDENNNYRFSWESRTGKKFNPVFEHLKVGISISQLCELLKKLNILKKIDCNDPDFISHFTDSHNNEPILVKKMEYSGRLFGLVYVSFPIGLLVDDEEKKLFSDLVHDISHGLYNLEIERKHELALKEISEAEEKYRNLMEMANDAIFVTDADSETIIYANRKALDLIGLPGDEIIGKHLTQLHPKQDAAEMVKLFRKIKNQKNSVFRLRIYSYKYRKCILVEVTANMVDVGKNKIVQGIFREIEGETNPESLDNPNKNCISWVM